MKAVLYILFSWALTTGTAWALGTLVLRKLRLRLHRSEEILLGFITGTACLSALIFIACALHVAYKGVFLLLAVASFMLAWRSPACTPPEEPLATVPRIWRMAFATVFAVFTFVYFFNALAPELSPDGAGYHVPVLATYYHAHGFARMPWNMYANLSQGVELVFLMAYAFGHSSAAAMVHFSFLLALPWLMLTYGRRFGYPVAGAAAAMLVFASPMIGRDGTSAYIDLVVAGTVFGVFYFLQLWDRERDSRLLIPAGILAGFAFAGKYTAGIAIPYAIGFVAWKAWRSRTPILRPALVVASLAFAMTAPWLIKNWLFVHDPLAPFYNAIFPNPYFHVSTEQDLRTFLKTFEIPSRLEIPFEITISGARLHGIYGPIFLIAPLALLALWKPAGRKLLLAAAVFGAFYFDDIEVRFLMNAVVFISLALALVLQNIRGLLLALTLIHAVLSYPSVLRMYCSPSAWLLRTVPIGPALRKPPDDIYLSHTWATYLVDRMLEKRLSPTDKLFTFSALPESYTTRRVLVQSQAAPNDVLGDILLTAIVPDYQPAKIFEFRFPEKQLRRIRVVQTAASSTEQWSVAELRVYDGDRELPRDPKWRLSASPNPWDVQLAFDNAPSTRWRSWQLAEPGMFIEVDLGAPRSVDSVRLQACGEAGLQMRLEGMDASGNWSALAGEPSVTVRPLTANLRLAATRELKYRGVGHILLESTNYGAQDFSRYADEWGIKEDGRVGQFRLYRID